MIAVLRDIASSVMHIKQTDNIFDDWWQKFDEQPSLRSNKLKRIIASNEGLNWGLIDVPLPTQRTSELADIIDIDIQDDSKLWWDETRKQHLYSQMNPNHQAKLSVMIQSPSYVYGTVFRRMRAGSSMAELRTDGVAGCLRTPRGGSSKQILVRAGGGSWDVRLLTPREYARLQGVRDTFLLPDNLNKGYFAMGDAVCVPAIEHLSKHVLLPLFKGIE